MRKFILFSVAVGLSAPSKSFSNVSKESVLNNPKVTQSLLASSKSALQNAVQGVVTGPDGPMSEVSVVVIGGTAATKTDAQGQFKITATVGSKLRFSSIGYVSQDVVVSSNTINIILQEDNLALDEVVVVGYGSQKRSNVTGSVTTVDAAKTFETRPITDAGRALQGAVSGLTISSPSGDLGGDPQIRLRGVSGSLQTSGGASPLILVDGVEVPSLSMINPTDIESMSVIKDASAAIYGSRAAWGVVLIKTKSGKRNTKTSINYSNNFAWQKPTTTPKLASAPEGVRAGLLAMQRTNPALAGYSNLGIRYDDYAIDKMREWNQLYEGQDLGSDMLEGRDYEVKDGNLYVHRSWDAEDLFMKDFTPQQNHNLSIAGGSEKVNYNAGFGLVSQSGVLKVNSDQYNRYNFNLGVNADITSWLTGYAKVLYSASDVTKPFIFNTSETYDPWFYLYRWQRNYPYGTIDGVGTRNAITETEQANMNLTKDNMARFTFGAKATILPGLVIDGDYSYTSFTNKYNENGGSVSGYDFWNLGGFKQSTWTSEQFNRVKIQRGFNDRHVGNLYATFSKSLNQHNFKVMAGANAELYNADMVYSQRLGLLDPAFPQIGLADGTITAGSEASHWSTLGFFGRINYDFADKYLVEVLARKDGSSRFNKANTWGFFPAASLGYVVSKEDYMDWSKSFLDFFKIRASIGSVGNQTVPNSLYLSTLRTDVSDWVINGENKVTMTTPSVVSEDLTWETVTTKEIGFDAVFFKNKLNVTFNKYRRTVSDLITGGVMQPASFGAPSPLRNFGEMQTNGWELELAYNHQFSNGLGMRLSGQLSDYTEKISKYDGSALVYASGLSSNYAGKMIGEIWGYETDRLFQEGDFTKDNSGQYILNGGIPSQSYYETATLKYGPGDVKYKDLNGDGVIGVGDGTVENPGDRKILGNTTPRYQYGFRADFNYKGFDLGVFVQGVGERSVWAGGALAIPGWRPGEAWYDYQMDYWTPENTDAYYYRPTDQLQSNEIFNAMPQSRYLMNMSYVRLKNLTFGYSLPEEVVKRAKFQKARIFFSGENLFEITNLDVPIDPETDYTVKGKNDKNSFGRSYPYRRTFSFGVQLTF